MNRTAKYNPKLHLWEVDPPLPFVDLKGNLAGVTSYIHLGVGIVEGRLLIRAYRAFPDGTHWSDHTVPIPSAGGGHNIGEVFSLLKIKAVL